MLPIRAVVALLHVRSVRASIAFYQRLGFRVANKLVPDGAAEPVWASLENDNCTLMLRQGRAREQAVTLWLYVDDVAAKRDELMAEGIAVSEIDYPSFNPRGEFRLEDPDGNELWISHT